jgi:hypothetical protein
MSVVFPALSRPCCFEQRGLSVHRKKADSSSHLPATIERKRERDLRRKRYKEKREEKKKKPAKKQSARKKSAYIRTKNKIFASFFHNPKVERMS